MRSVDRRIREPVFWAGENGYSMQLPDIYQFRKNPLPTPYARQMGETIVALVGLFQHHVPGHETNEAVLNLALTLDRWSAAHAIFDCVRRRLLVAIAVKDPGPSCPVQL